MAKTIAFFICAFLFLQLAAQSHQNDVLSRKIRQSDVEFPTDGEQPAPAEVEAGTGDPSVDDRFALPGWVNPANWFGGGNQNQGRPNNQGGQNPNQGWQNQNQGGQGWQNQGGQNQGRPNNQNQGGQNQGRPNNQGQGGQNQGRPNNQGGQNNQNQQQQQQGQNGQNQQPTPAPGQTTPAPTPRPDCLLSCPVTPEYNPICGSNRQTYTNPSRLECARRCGLADLQQRRLGPCRN